MLKTTLGRLRLIALIEGISYLLLLGVAMPLKYLWGMPIAVRVVGMAHGILFVLFCAALFQAFLERRWTLFRAGLVFVSSLVPFGTFVMDRELRREEQGLAPIRTQT